MVNGTPEMTSDLKFIIRRFIFLANLQFAVFIRGYELKKESKIALKKVDLSLFFPTKKVPVNPQKHAF